MTDEAYEGCPRSASAASMGEDDLRRREVEASEAIAAELKRANDIAQRPRGRVLTRGERMAQAWRSFFAGGPG